MQACASELTRGHHIWSQVIGNGVAEAFLQDPNGAAYLQALRQVWVVALLLQASADVHGISSHETSTTQHAFAEASRQSMARVLGTAPVSSPSPCKVHDAMSMPLALCMHIDHVNCMNTFAACCACQMTHCSKHQEYKPKLLL